MKNVYTSTQGNALRCGLRVAQNREMPPQFADAAVPVAPHSKPGGPSFQELREAHARLAAHYVMVLNLATRPSRIPPAQRAERRPSRVRARTVHEALRVALTGPRSPTALFQYFAAQYLVQVHVRRRLLLLGDAYTRLAQAVDDSQSADYRDWLKEAAAGSREMASTCASLRLPSILALLPLVVTLAVKASHVHTRASWLVPVAVYAVAIGLILHLVLCFGFALKRRYLLTPLDETPEASSVYRSENELFWLLGRRKPLEYPFDVTISQLLAFDVWY